MPYVVQPIDSAVRRAMGEFAPAPPYEFVFESAMPSLYVSEQMGMTVESATAVPRVAAGEFVNTVKGDFLRVSYTTTDSSGAVVTTEAVVVDVGAGSEQLQTVEYDDVPPPVETPTSETSVSLDPNANLTVETTVHSETLSPDTVDYTVGETAGSTVTLADGYEYSSSGTASATADLIAYGELDVNGNPVAVTDTATPDSSNLEAIYA